MNPESAVLQRLSGLDSLKTVILAIGNVLKGDDGAACAVIEKLKGKVGAELVDAGTVPENYIGRIIKKRPDSLIVIDAVDFDSAPGSIGILKPGQLSGVVLSTHSLSPRLFIDMIRTQLQLRVYFIGIQPSQTKMGRPLSPQVSAAVDRLAEMLIEVFAR